MIATETGRVTAYALDALYDRGFFFVQPGDEVYEGQIVGEHCKDNDIPVNAAQAKQMTNMRTVRQGRRRPGPPGAGHERSKACLEYIQEDELVEITPKSHPHAQASAQGKRPQARGAAAAAAGGSRGMTMKLTG